MNGLRVQCSWAFGSSCAFPWASSPASPPIESRHGGEEWHAGVSWRESDEFLAARESASSCLNPQCKLCMKLSLLSASIPLSPSAWFQSEEEGVLRSTSSDDWSFAFRPVQPSAAKSVLSSHRNLVRAESSGLGSGADDSRDEVCDAAAARGENHQLDAFISASRPSLAHLARTCGS